MSVRVCIIDRLRNELPLYTLKILHESMLGQIVICSETVCRYLIDVGFLWRNSFSFLLQKTNIQTRHGSNRFLFVVQQQQLEQLASASALRSLIRYNTCLLVFLLPQTTVARKRLRNGYIWMARWHTWMPTHPINGWAAEIFCTAEILCLPLLHQLSTRFGRLRLEVTAILGRVWWDRNGTH